MRKVEKLVVSYFGYKDPENEDELLFEILGLENAIKNAELRITTLRQGLRLSKIMKTSKINDGDKDEKNLNSSDKDNKQDK